MPKQKKGDASPNHLYQGIQISTNRGTQIELYSDVQYEETGTDQFDFTEGQEYEEVSAEAFLVDQLQQVAANTAGTNHNEVFRVAGFLNYVHKQGYVRGWKTPNYSQDEFGAIDKYYLPVSGGFFTWEARPVAA